MKPIAILMLFLSSHFFLSGQTIQQMVLCPHDTIVCLKSDGFALSGAIPDSGIYSGPGITISPSFNPGLANIGKHLITYTLPSNEFCTFYITVIDIPAVGNINSTDPFVCEGDVRTYSVDPIPYVLKYHWKFSASPFDTITSFPTVTINFTGNYNSGELTVMGINQCDSSTSNAFHITVNPKPIPTIKNLSDTLAFTDNVCQNQRLTYSADGDFSTVKWSVTGGSVEGDDNSRIVNVIWGRASGNGSLIASVEKNNCQGAAVREVVIGNDSAPVPAKIWLFGRNMLVCSDSMNAANEIRIQCYQWYKGAEVVGTKRYYVADSNDKSSLYTVKTSFDPDCSCANASKTFKFGQKETISPGQKMVVVPNPAHDKITLKFSPAAFRPGRLLLFSQLGIKVQEDVVTSPGTQTDISRLPAGIYFLEYVVEKQGVFSSRLIKL
jgi:hypothetical protein